MGALARFYLPPASWQLTSPALEGDEARHCISVMRHREGDEIILFNGEGAWARCHIAGPGPAHVPLQVLEHGLTPPPAARLSLVQAVPKGGNMEWIIEKAVELGVTTIHPVLTDRTVVRLDPREASRKQEKWRRIIMEACKQCGQNWLPEIHAPAPYREVMVSLPPHDLRLIAAIQEDSRPLKSILQARAQQQAGEIHSALLCIGPEGDFTPDEYQLARDHACLPMTLGPIILRVETATMYGLSVLRHELAGEA